MSVAHQIEREAAEEGASRMQSLIPGSPWVSPGVTDITETVILEATSNCNLRCTYCSVSQPEYKGRDMSPELEDRLYDGLCRRPPKLLVLNGHGETTMIRGWEKRYRRFIDRFPVGMTSNFSRIFTASELEAITLFKSINISWDTHDAQLLAQVRRKVKLENILTNLANIRRTAAELKRKPPEIHVFCTVYDLNVFTLDAFAEFLLPLKIDAVHWGNLMRHPDIDDGVNVNVLTSLSREEQLRAYRTLERATKILERAGVTVGYWGEENYFEAMKEALERPIHLPVRSIRNNIVVDEDHSVMLWQNSFVQACGRGETRDCLDPWNYAHLEAGGGVLPCCVRGGPVGVVDDKTPLSEVINNKEIRKLRENLLLGRLDPECATCAVRSPISLSEFRRKALQRYMKDVLLARAQGPWLARAARRLISGEPPEHKVKRVLFPLLKMAAPEALVRFLAGAYPAGVPEGFRGALRFENVRRGYHGLGDRIYLRPNMSGSPAAAICFEGVELGGIAEIALGCAKSNGSATAVRFRCSVLAGNELLVVAEQVLKEQNASWNISVRDLSGPHRLRIEAEMAEGAGEWTPVDAYVDYPLLVAGN